MATFDGPAPEWVAHPLDRDDPHVEAAREAETAVYDHYGLEPDEHVVDVPSLRTRVRVVEVGAGPPVVMLPGGIGHGVGWAPLLRTLDGYTAYVVDRPGGGLSDGLDYRDQPLRTAAVESTLAVVDHLGIARAPLVGNSMGGLWSLRFAIAHPDRVSAIALVGTPALYPGTSAPLPMRLLSLPVVGPRLVGPLLQSDDVSSARDGLAFLGHPPSTRERLPEAYVTANYHTDNRPDVARTWSSLLRRALRPWGAHPRARFTREDLRAVDAPVTLLWGRDDPFGSIDRGRAGADAFVDAAFLEVGVGHLPWLDAPERCGEIVREFLGTAG